VNSQGATVRTIRTLLFPISYIDK